MRSLCVWFGACWLLELVETRVYAAGHPLLSGPPTFLNARRALLAFFATPRLCICAPTREGARCLMPQLVRSQRAASAVRRAAADPATAPVGSPAPGPASRPCQRVRARACGATSADSCPTRRSSRSACGAVTALRRQSSEGHTRASTPSACGLVSTRITSPPAGHSMHR